MRDPASQQTFAYTAQCGTFFTIVGIFSALMLIESSVFLLLALVLIANPLLKWTVLGAIMGLILFLMIGIMLSALRTKHSLTNDRLHLQYGHLLDVTIPRAIIKKANTVHEHLTLIDPIAARYDTKKQRITACFSEQGQILLTFIEPIAIKLGLQEKTVRTILINCDRPDDLLTALQTNTAKTQEMRTKQDEEHIQEKMKKLAQIVGTTKNEGTDQIAIRIEGLSRSFKQFVAIDKLNMEIQTGEIYGLLGSNGAGKTTTIKMLVGLLMPSAGKIEMGGYDIWQYPEEVKKNLGYVADRSLLYERLSGGEYLEFLAQIRGLESDEAEKRIKSLLELLELKEQTGKLCGSYSFGMKRKLSLAGALLHQPKILILDEPLNGLDPRSARRLKELFLELAGKGTTILLSTHDLATAEQICDRVGIFHKGRLLIEGSAKELQQAATASDLEEIFLQLTEEQEKARGCPNTI